VVSGTPLVLTVRRCQCSYKFIGHDLARCAIYYGYVYRPQVLEIIDVTQPKPPTDEDVERSPRLRFYKDTSVKPWQHERVLELLLSMLALTEPIGSLTNELRALDKHRTLVCHPTRAQTVNGPSIQRTIGLSRTLKDEALALQVYERQQLREKRFKETAAISSRHKNQAGADPEKLKKSKRKESLSIAEEAAQLAAADDGMPAGIDVAKYRSLIYRIKPDLTFEKMRYHQDAGLPQDDVTRRWRKDV